MASPLGLSGSAADQKDLRATGGGAGGEAGGRLRLAPPNTSRLSRRSFTVDGVRSG
jgi:hypothetical protein